eukprot:PhM_4_TR15305/c0_g1_i1/m.36132
MQPFTQLPFPAVTIIGDAPSSAASYIIVGGTDSIAVYRNGTLAAVQHHGSCVHGICILGYARAESEITFAVCDALRAVSVYTCTTTSITVDLRCDVPTPDALRGVTAAQRKSGGSRLLLVHDTYNVWVVTPPSSNNNNSNSASSTHKCSIERLPMLAPAPITRVLACPQWGAVVVTSAGHILPDVLEVGCWVDASDVFDSVVDAAVVAEVVPGTAANTTTTWQLVLLCESMLGLWSKVKGTRQIEFTSGDGGANTTNQHKRSLCIASLLNHHGARMFALARGSELSVYDVANPTTALHTVRASSHPTALTLVMGTTNNSSNSKSGGSQAAVVARESSTSAAASGAVTSMGSLRGAAAVYTVGSGMYVTN